MYLSGTINLRGFAAPEESGGPAEEKGGPQDLIYEFAPEPSDDAADIGLIPMLTPYSRSWQLSRMCPAWREYVNKIWCKSYLSLCDTP